MGCNQILDRYIEQLIETSTPQAPAWNIEKIRAGKENTWNYIDGCMIKALIELYEITGEQRYLTFADDYIDFFVAFHKTHRRTAKDQIHSGLCPFVVNNVLQHC